MFIPVRSLGAWPGLKILSSELVQRSRYLQRFCILLGVAPFVPQPPHPPTSYPADTAHRPFDAGQQCVQLRMRVRVFMPVCLCVCVAWLVRGMLWLTPG